jgi:DNA-binding LacI/PurR family transcriptional regulator
VSKRSGPPSAHDVARLIGMSQAAVSRAYTPGACVSEATRQKVFAAARQLGYRPNLLARSLVRGRSDIIGVVVGTAGAGQIATHLVEQGYRSFGFMAGNDYWVSHEREQALTAALQSHGFAPPEREVGHFQREGARQAMRLLLTREPRFEAIFCANDNMALAAHEIARYEFGIEVGRELGIAEFDGMEEAAWPSFNLTTYAQPIERIMEVVTDILLGAPLARPEEIVVQGELNIRGSTRRSPKLD